MPRKEQRTVPHSKQSRSSVHKPKTKKKPSTTLPDPSSGPELIDPQDISLQQKENPNLDTTPGATLEGKKPKAIIRPASLLSRTLAFIFDLLLIDLFIFSWFRNFFVHIIPSDASLTSLIGSASQETQSLSPHLSLVISTMMFLMMAYFIFFEYLFSQTPGKFLFRLKSISSSQLIERVQKHQTTMDEIRQKVINSDQTVDIHQEMKKQMRDDPDMTKGITFSLTFWQTLLRWIIFIPFLPFTLLLFIDPLYLLIKRQRLTEVISKTTVVEIIPTSFPYAQKLIERLQRKNIKR